MVYFLFIFATTLLSFQEFDQVNLSLNQEIEITGFIYEVNGQFVLSKTPNLKSCCVMKEDNHYLILNSSHDITLTKNAVTLKGTLQKVNKIYILENINLVEKDNTLTKLSLCFAFISILGGIIVKFKRKSLIFYCL